MEIKRIESNWPYERKAARLEQSILSIIEIKARQQLDISRLMILSVSLSGKDFKKEIDEFKPEFIICHSFVDPTDETLPVILSESGVPYIIIGNSDTYRIDFWAMAAYLFFANYDESELTINPKPKKYLCYNRKPHFHRIDIVRYLQASVANEGHISFGTSGPGELTIGKIPTESDIQIEWSDPTISDKIPNDVFSLGDLSVWNDAYLCLVTETLFRPKDFFISEKTWKPIIGLRPFFIFGQPGLRAYLKDNGFDIFEDIFDYSTIKTETCTADSSKVAISAINNLSDPQKHFYQIRKRLLRNRQRFYQYATEQWEKLEKLNLNELYGKARI